MARLTLTELLFGNNEPTKYAPILLRAFKEKEKVTPEEAQEILKAVTHPEVKAVYEDLEKQVKEGSERPTYDSKDYDYVPGYLASNPRKHFMFAADYQLDIYGLIVHHIIERAFPGYRIRKNASVFGKLVLEKV